MGYTFNGVFLQDSSTTLADIEKLFSGYAKEISVPFQGVGVSFAEWVEEKDHDEIKQEVLRCSRLLGMPTLVYIFYSTFGGPCEYSWGFACKNGELIEGSKMEMEDDIRAKVLRHLLSYLGYDLPGSYFHPFEREFFPNT